jgi:hypothetical protein
VAKGGIGGWGGGGRKGVEGGDGWPSKGGRMNG